MRRRAPGVARSRGERTSTHARRRVFASPWPAIAPRRATLGSACSSCRAKCQRAKGSRGRVRWLAGERAARHQVISNSCQENGGCWRTHDVHAQPCPRRPSRGAPSTAGRLRLAGAVVRPRGNARWSEEPQARCANASSAFRSPPVGSIVFAIFPPKPIAGSAPPLAPFPSTSPLTRRPHRRRPFVRVRRRSHRGRRQRPGRRRPQGGAAFRARSRVEGREGAHQSSVAAVKGFENQANQIAEAIKKQERGDAAVDPMVMHPSAEWRRYWDSHFNFIVLDTSASTPRMRLAFNLPRWAAGTCSSLSSTSTPGSTS